MKNIGSAISILAMLEKFIIWEENKFFGKGGAISSLSRESISPGNMSLRVQTSLDYLDERTHTDMDSVSQVSAFLG